MHGFSGLGRLIVKPLLMDMLTTLQSRIAFARICIEIKDGALPPKSIIFTNEYGQECSLEVKYEWMPSPCLNIELLDVFVKKNLPSLRMSSQ